MALSWPQQSWLLSELQANFGDMPLVIKVYQQVKHSWEGHRSSDFEFSVCIHVEKLKEWEALRLQSVLRTQ